MNELVHLLLRFREATLDCAREIAPGVRRGDLRWCVRADRQPSVGMIRLVLSYEGHAVFDRPYSLERVSAGMDDPEIASGLRSAMREIAGRRSPIPAG
ncbi:MAG: hypothetical protein HY749_20370 [Gammaproteobacteria bacterium]|nr:hypothetical protein [Gammaproteobacteria bacterium]MBI5618797.1 hypothetical protein [Gammaproteobacteria bacterium]